MWSPKPPQQKITSSSTKHFLTLQRVLDNLSRHSQIMLKSRLPQKAFSDKNESEIPAQRHRGHSLTACNAAPLATPNRPLNPKWPTGSGKGSNPRLLGAPVNFCYISFLIHALLVFRPIRGLEIQNGRQWAPKWPTGSGKEYTPRSLGILSNFH